MSALLKFWIGLGVYLNVAGWVLSALRLLNGPAYLLVLMVFVALAWAGRREWLPGGVVHVDLQKYRRRFSRPLPLLFLVATVLVFIGGVLYAPANYDALTYRFPRVLNWLSAGGWFWIPTINARMNYSGVGIEWFTAPQFALLGTDRALFLFNVINFLLLPGLLFSVFARLGVARRVAWLWMWLLPFGFGYVMQAGGVGNDLAGAVYLLASLHFGLRARASRRVPDVWFALLAAALLTGIKLSNLPLALPCLVAVWPALPALRRPFVASFAVICVAVFSSALPVMALNQVYSGKWNGDPQNHGLLQVRDPVAGVLVNSFQLAQHALMPPVFPGALSSRKALDAALPAAWQDYIHREFPRYYLGAFQELPSEENAALGLGVTVVVCGMLVMGWRSPRWTPWTSAPNLIIASAYVALGAYLVKMGSEAGPRLLLPYYPLLLLPALRCIGLTTRLRGRACRWGMLAVALSVFPAILLSPARPLLPMSTIAQAWLERHPESPLARRLAVTYAIYAGRNDLLQPVRRRIPDSARVIAFAGSSNDAEYSLWRPFGARVVRCLWQQRERSEARVPAGAEWLVVHAGYWDTFSSVPLSEWAARHHFQVVDRFSIAVFARGKPEDWYLLRLDNPAAAGVIPPAR